MCENRIEITGDLIRGGRWGVVIGGMIGYGNVIVDFHMSFVV